MGVVAPLCACTGGALLLYATLRGRLIHLSFQRENTHVCNRFRDVNLFAQWLLVRQRSFDIRYSLQDSYTAFVNDIQLAFGEFRYLCSVWGYRNSTRCCLERFAGALARAQIVETSSSSHYFFDTASTPDNSSGGAHAWGICWDACSELGMRWNTMTPRLTYYVGTFTVFIGLGESSTLPNVYMGLRALKTSFHHPCPAYFGFPFLFLWILHYCDCIFWIAELLRGFWRMSTLQWSVESIACQVPAVGSIIRVSNFVLWNHANVDAETSLPACNYEFRRKIRSHTWNVFSAIYEQRKLRAIQCLFVWNSIVLLRNRYNMFYPGCRPIICTVCRTLVCSSTPRAI